MDRPTWWDEDCEDEVQWASQLRLSYRKFRPSDAVALNCNGARVVRRFDTCSYVPHDAEVINTGWDHEHCSFVFCNRRISLHPEDDHVGYVDESGNSWFCEECYEQFIRPVLEHS